MKCEICGAVPIKKGFQLPRMYSLYIEGNPVVCDKCVIEKLTGKKYEWIDIVKDNIKYEPI